MSTWKCIICGTVINSKCPGHRSEFYNFHTSVAMSVVTLDRIDYGPESGCSELFVSYTTSAESTTAEQFRNLSELLLTDNTIEAMSCDHRWVMNSETERKCCLDHEHRNLTDVDKLKEEIAATKKPRTMQEVVSDFGYFVRTPIDLARKTVNRSKPTFDSFIEAEFDKLKVITQHALDGLAEGRTFRPMYRCLMSSDRWAKDAKYATFNTEEDAIAFARGHNKHLDLERLSTEDDSGYRSFEYDMTTNCVFCGKVNLPDSDGTIIKLPEGEAHLKCLKRSKNDAKVKTRYSRFSVKAMIHMDYYELERIAKIWNFERLDSYILDDRGTTTVICVGTMNKDDFEKAVTHLKTDVFITKGGSK